MFPNRNQPRSQPIASSEGSFQMMAQTSPEQRSSRPRENVLPPSLRQVDQFPYRVLVVDDEPSIREMAAPLLESQGYEVLTASDGVDGLLALSKSLPDVIISDLHMPGMSGFEFLTIVRRRFPRIAIIAMSGAYVPGESLALISADGFWQKGQPVQQLFQEIARIVEPLPIVAENAIPGFAPLLLKKDSAGNLLVRCPKCLHPNRIDAIGLNGGIHETICPVCSTAVKYEIDHSAKPGERSSPL